MGFLNISWWIWGGLTLMVGLVYVFFVPKAKLVNATKGLRFVTLRWFHSLVWVMLALSCFMRGAQLMVGCANPVALLGGILYVVYLITFVRLKEDWFAN